MTIRPACIAGTDSGQSTTSSRLMKKLPLQSTKSNPYRSMSGICSTFSTRLPPRPHHQFDWHEHIKEVENEYKAARMAVDHLSAAIVADPSVLGTGDPA